MADPVILFAFRTYGDPAADGTAPFNTYDSFLYDWYWLSYQGTDVDELIESLVTYYADLLIIQYREQPNAYAMMKAIIRPTIMGTLLLQIQNAFNLTGDNIAVGKQLDTLGKYVGVSRSGNGFTSQIILNDDDFLTLINMGIVRNNSGSSLASIQLFLNQYFSGEIYVFDYTGMMMSYLIDSNAVNENLIQLFVTEGLLPRPMGVALSIISNDVIDKFFGLRTYFAEASPLATPLNSYSSYQNSWLSLSYAYGVNI